MAVAYKRKQLTYWIEFNLGGHGKWSVGIGYHAPKYKVLADFDTAEEAKVYWKKLQFN